MDEIIPWVATAATVTAALMTASNLGSRITGYGFVVFTLGSLAWLSVGAMTGQAPLLWTNVVLTVVNLFGVWRWLGRQTRLETGAEAAAQASQVTPGEALFPVSLLLRADVTGADGGSIGECVDAMAGCRSGRIDYVVVSQGGVAGVGETLRRLEWSNAEVHGEQLRTDLSSSQFELLKEMPKERWPGR